MEKKLFGIICAVVFLSGSVALALDPMGPPAAGLGKGKWGIGAEYSYSDQTIVRHKNAWGNVPYTADTTMHKVYGNIGYGIAENVDGFVRLGVANLEWDRIGGSRDHDFKGDDGDWDFLWGGGIKATLCESPDVAWGFLAQFSDGALGGHMKTGDGEKGSYKITINEIQLAVGPTWKASDTVRIYGGPFVDLINGEWEDNFDGDKMRKAIGEEGWLGGYIGTEINLAQNSALTVEFMLTSDAWAVAGGVCWKM